MKLFDRIYTAVKTIPEGKVLTYGQVGAGVGIRDFRRVGQALHANKDPAVPCHRVVFADGGLAPGYSFGGAGEQRKRLEREKILFIGGKVDLTECGQVGGEMIKSSDFSKKVRICTKPARAS